MNFKLNLFFSPLEQFEISSYNIFFNYITTYPLELYENLYMISTDKYFSIYTIFDLIFIFFIVKSFEFFLKNHSFIFLYTIILILLTCLNINSFIDFVILEGATELWFHENLEEHGALMFLSSLYMENYPDLMIFRDTDYVYAHAFKNLDLLIEFYYSDVNWNSKSEINDLNEDTAFFISDQLIPNLILNVETIISYTWFLMFVFNLNLLSHTYSGNEIDWFEQLNNLSNLFNLGNVLNDLTVSGDNYDYKDEIIGYIGFCASDIMYDRFLFAYDETLKATKDLIDTQQIKFEDSFGFGLWAGFLIIITAIALAAEPEKVSSNGSNCLIDNIFDTEIANIYMHTISPCTIKRCGEVLSDVENLNDFVMTTLSSTEINNIYNEIIENTISLMPFLFCLENITAFNANYIWSALTYTLADKAKEMLHSYDVNLFTSYIYEYMSWMEGEVNTAFLEDIFFYVTLNTSFINIYSILFCFIFIYAIIYLIFNKNLSVNTNTLIPNIYQIFGENLYKISLNLFYSVLGKNITHPEFFIKINTIFIFLIISNVQGMIPYISTLTSALTNTFFIALALFISILITLFDKKGLNYFLNLFMPSGCPIFLVFLLIPIEFISYSFRVVSLSVRLFANMMAGHTLLKVIVGFSWVIVFLENMFLINIFPIIILFILTLLEFGVALIQAYIFTILSCIYLRDIFQGH